MNKKYIFTIFVIVLLGFVFFKLNFFKSPEKNTEEKINTEEAIKETEQDKTTLETSAGATRYENEKYGFSFDKPAGYTVGVLRDEQGESLLVQNSKANSSFQIYITSINSPINLTKEQIQTDLPGTSVVNAKIIKLDSKASGIMFESNNSAMSGGSYEIWFSYQSFLYQVSSYKSFSIELQKIIGTWRFTR